MATLTVLINGQPITVSRDDHGWTTNNTDTTTAN